MSFKVGDTVICGDNVAKVLAVHCDEEITVEWVGLTACGGGPLTGRWPVDRFKPAQPRVKFRPRAVNIGDRFIAVTDIIKALAVLHETDSIDATDVLADLARLSVEKVTADD